MYFHKCINKFDLYSVFNLLLLLLIRMMIKGHTYYMLKDGQPGEDIDYVAQKLKTLKIIFTS